MANSLGKASLVLTADSSDLDSGLSKSEKKVGSFFDRMKTSLTPGTGAGAINRLLFGTPEHDGETGEKLGSIGGAIPKLKGGVAGIAVAAGAAVAGVMAIAGAAFAVKEALSSALETSLALAESNQFANGNQLNDQQTKTVRTLLAGVEELKTAWEEVSIAISPVITMVSGYLLDAFEAIKPLIQPLIDGFAQVAKFVGAVSVEVVKLGVEAVTWIQGILQQIVDWIAELTGVATEHVNFENLVVAVLKNVAWAFGYVWDTIKAGVGVVAFVAGKIVSVFGDVLEVLADIVKMAKSLPDELRPDWVDDLGSGLDKFAKKSQATGASMQEWGKRQIGAWGESFGAINQWFAKLDNKKRQFNAKPLEVDYHATGAFEKDSKEALSIESRFKFDNMMRESDQKRATRLAGDQLKTLQKIEEQLKKSPLLAVLG